ncbi:MAG TPA: kelch repeat-containing protein, partial [Thermoanaerobaculia bacterium]|nr:kelch repeat-containing protein [Thermoanaerobaculia bacterium]
ATVPAAVAAAALVAAEGRLYQIGGFDAKGNVTHRVDIYDPAGNAWQGGPALPTAVAAAPAVVVGRRLYVLGGWTDQEKTPANAVQVLDLGTGKWSKGPALKVAVAGATAAAVDGKVYLISGWIADGPGGRKIGSDVQILDPGSGKWSKGANAALPAAGASAVVVDRQIYVVNGRIAGDQVTDRTTIYDVAADAWAPGGPSTIFGVYEAAIGRLGDRVYLVGGRAKVGGGTQQIVQELDLNQALGQQSWRPGVPPLAPVAAAGAAVLSGALYVSGGRTMLAADAAPGAATSAVQLFRPNRGWAVSGDVAVLSLSGVYFGTGAQYLAPGELALLLGQNFVTPGAPPATWKIKVGGLDAMVLPPAAGPLPPQILPFVVPPDLDPAPGKATLEIIKDGAPQQAPPLEIPIAPAAPVLFVFNYGELAEPTFLDNAGAMACNEDGSLNCANQPAKPGQALSLWATGLGKAPDKAQFSVDLGGVKVKVDAINPPPVPLPGVYLIRLIVPEGVPFASYLPTTVTANGKVTSNRVGVAIRADAFRTTPPIPCEAGLPAVFPGFPPPKP